MLQLHHDFILEMKMRSEKMENRSVKVKNMTLKIVMMGVEFCNHSEISKVILIWWRMNEI
jgi:hypothetical protein